MLCNWFELTFDRVVPSITMSRWLRRMGLTRKKGSRVALQQDPEKVALFWERLQRLGLDPFETVWFDECGFDSRDFRLEYGYSPRGERFYTAEKLGRGSRVNCLASMTVHGIFEVDFYDSGGITYDVFEEHCARKIVPKMLREGMRYLIMDNARIHHGHGDLIVRYFDALGITVVFLAPYHPQANPIGMVFNKCMCIQYVLLPVLM